MRAQALYFCKMRTFAKKYHGSVAVAILMFYTCLRVLLQRMVKQILVILS
jgi:hypothetical protein